MVKTVHCPKCGLELEAPGELLGKPATCPRCSTQFVVSARIASSSETEKEPEDSIQKGYAKTSGNVNRTSGSVDRPNPNSLSPSGGASSESKGDAFVGRGGKLQLNENGAGAAKFKGLPSQDSADSSPRNDADPNDGEPSRQMRQLSDTTDVEGSSNSHSSDRPAPAPVSGKPASSAVESRNGHEQSSVGKSLTPVPEVRPRQTKAETRRRSRSTTSPGTGEGAQLREETPQRRRQSAKMVSNSAGQSRLQLGADGALPELKVAEGPSKRRQGTETTESNPLTLIIILSVSVGMSLLILFMPTSLSSPPNASRQNALEQIESYYLGREPLAPYQVLLREAIREENRGNRTAANERYRLVLDMLHAEGLDPKRGVSGPAFASRPPNDKDLEEQLQILIRRRN